MMILNSEHFAQPEGLIGESSPPGIAFITLGRDLVNLVTFRNFPSFIYFLSHIGLSPLSRGTVLVGRQ